MAKDSEPPEVIMPVQFFPRASFSDMPEKRLMFAVLMDAITQLRTGDAEGVQEAERWIRDGAAGAAVSFVDACDAVGLDPGGLARGLIASGARLRFKSRPRHRVAQLGRLQLRRGSKAAASGAGGFVPKASVRSS